MTPEVALDVLSQVASKFVGTRAEHELVDQALKTIAAAIKQKPSEPKHES